jgi:Flp pilus assembly protein TadB
MRALLVAAGLAGIIVFVVGPDTGLGLAALPLGVAVVVGAGSAWLVHARRRDRDARFPAHDNGPSAPPG